MERSEVIGKVLHRYSETIFQIHFPSPFRTATTSFLLFHRHIRPLTGLLASAVAHLLPPSSWLAESPFRTPSSINAFSKDLMVVLHLSSFGLKFGALIIGQIVLSL